MTRDEHMRDKAALENLFDRCDAACFAESDVDDHQIRAPMRSGGHCLGDIGLHGANRVAETLERFREQSADHRVVLHDQGAQRFHRLTSPPAPPSFTQMATLLNDVDASASSPNLGETLLPAGVAGVRLRQTLGDRE